MPRSQRTCTRFRVIQAMERLELRATLRNTKQTQIIHQDPYIRSDWRFHAICHVHEYPCCLGQASTRSGEIVRGVALLCSSQGAKTEIISRPDSFALARSTIAGR